MQILKSNTHKTRASPSRSGSAGGSPFSDVERKLRVRSLLPLTLDYEPLESPANMKRLLGDLTRWVLERRIHHRAASACRGLIQCFIAVDEHEILEALEKRVKSLEESRGVTSN